jgi:hypothetical protein
MYPLDREARKADVNEGTIGTAWMNDEQISRFLDQGYLDQTPAGRSSLLEGTIQTTLAYR